MKEHIKINNVEYFIDDFSIVNEHVLKFTFSNKVNIDTLLSDMSIFNDIKMYTQGGLVCAEWNGYTTLYRHQDNIVYVSNDESVYVEPENPVIPETPKTLDEVKTEKITELSATCQNLIYDGVTIEIDGNKEHFSYKSEDQVNIKDAFESAKATGMSVPYHANNSSCKLYSPEQITELYIAAKTNLTHHETYFNQLKMYILTLDNIEAVEAINYGQELTGTYLESYNEIMLHAKALIQAYFGGEK